MEIKMLPSNSFTYNFNGPPFNSFVHPSAHHHHLNSSIDLIDNGQNSEHVSSHLIDDNLQNNQLYELHPRTSQANYNQSNLENSNEDGIPVISFFKLKSFLHSQPKKPTSTSMQSMFSTGQELTSTNLQLLSSTAENGMNLINHESNLNHSPIQTTSTSFYNNLAPSAIGSSAIVSNQMLLSQSSDQVSVDSMRNNSTSIGSTNHHHQLINFEAPNLRSNPPQSTQLSSTTHVRSSNPRLTSREMPIRNFICKYCKETFQSKGEMQIHYTGHHREPKPFKCEQCPKRFQKQNYLKQHKRVHTNETPFQCTYTQCQKRFKQQSHLVQHIRTHTGAKPYKCKYSDCDKCFSQESNLRSHMRSHESGKPFKCCSCHLTFEIEEKLFEHIPRHRETKHTKIFICDYCGKSYNQELYLSKHVHAKHADKISQNLKVSSSIQNSTISTNQSRTKTKLNEKSNEQLRNNSFSSNSPSNSPSSISSSSIKSNLNKSKKHSSPISYSNVSNNCLPVQQTSTPTHINYSTTANNNSWNKSTAGTSSPDSVNSSNCMSSSTNSEMINLSTGNNLNSNLTSSNNLNNSIGQLTDNNMFTELNNVPTSIQSNLPSRYDNLQQSVDLFYNHPANSMSSNGQHQSAFTALGRTNQNSPKYFTNSYDSFVFNKPQYSSISSSATNSTTTNQLHSGQATNQQQQISNQQLLSQQINQQQQHNLEDSNQILQSSNQQTGQSLQMHQLSPLNNHLTSSSTHTSNLLSNSAQSSPVQHLHHHLQHSQTASQQQTNQHSQLIALNQIRNYACMPNNSSIGSSTSILPTGQANSNSTTFVNNIFLNAQNNNNSMSGYNDCPIMILQ